MAELDFSDVDPAALKAIIEGSGVPYRNGKISYIFDCPRCGKREKLYVRKRDGRFVCWFCKTIDGFEGRPEWALRELFAMPLKEIRGLLYGVEGQVAGDSEIEFQLADFWDENETNPTELEALDIVHWPYDFYDLDHPHARKGVEYMELRGIPRTVAAEYNIRYTPLKRRVAFPVQRGDQLYGWQARTILKDTVGLDESGRKTFEIPKILTTTGLKKERTLMFHDRLTGSKHAVLAEGPVDALKAHLAGGNVCTMGKAVSIEQIDLIADSGVERVYLGLDPDAALEMDRLVQEFTSRGLWIYELRAPKPYKDLGEMSMLQVRDLFREAPRVNGGHLFMYLN